MKKRRFAKLSCLLAGSVGAWMAGASGSAEADCEQTVHELLLELVELEVLGDAEGAREDALAQERAVIANEPRIEGDYAASRTESIYWRANGTFVTLEKRSMP